MNDLLRAAPRPWMVRALAQYNPFYLLSALCMLAGLFALNGSLNFSPLPAGNLLLLILVLNVYEFLLIGIGIFLARRRLMRDAATLLVLEAFFLVDVGFLNAEAFTQDFELGLAINVFLLVLAVAKLGIIFLGLGLPLSDTRLVLILVQVLILLAIPGYLKLAAEWRRGWLPPLYLYGVWWVVGTIPMLYAMLWKQEHPERHAGVIKSFTVLSTASILVHLSLANWVYNVRWDNANLSPLILGLSLAIGVSDWHVRNMTARLRTHLLLPILAIVLAISGYPRLYFPLDPFMMTPLRLTLVAAAAVYLYGLILHRHAHFGIAAVLCVGFAGLGHDPAAMSRNTSSAGRGVLSFLWGLVPRTLTHWGIIAVAMSFVLLALGVLMSLLRLGSREPMRVITEEEVNVN